MIQIAPGLRVTASLHARDRALLRIPELRDVKPDDVSRWVERHAGEALRDGRKALRCPRWCIRDNEDGLYRRGKASRHGTARFVWNEAESVVFLVRRITDLRFPGEKTWLVQTVMTPEPALR